jgi:hypothetical protein
MHFQSENDANSWLHSYDCYLRDVAGAAAATRIRYRRVVRRFVAACFDNTVQWATPSVQQIWTSIDRLIAQWLSDVLFLPRATI